MNSWYNYWHLVYMLEFVKSYQEAINLKIKKCPLQMLQGRRFTLVWQPLNKVDRNVIHHSLPIYFISPQYLTLHKVFRHILMALYKWMQNSIKVPFIKSCRIVICKNLESCFIYFARKISSFVLAQKANEHLSTFLEQICLFFKKKHTHIHTTQPPPTIQL